MKSKINLSNKETRQETVGSMRVAELQAIAKVAKKIKAKAYISIGCQDGGDLLSLDENYKAIPRLTIDQAIDPVSRKLKPEASDAIKGFLSEHPGKLLCFTNGKRKMDELKELLPFMKPGDVLGVHDWGQGPMTVMKTHTEVDETRCQFIYQAGLRLFKPVESWIQHHACLQRFWIKPKGFWGFLS
jgi:hypothetical protein